MAATHEGLLQIIKIAIILLLIIIGITFILNDSQALSGFLKGALAGMS